MRSKAMNMHRLRVVPGSGRGEERHASPQRQGTAGGRARVAPRRDAPRDEQRRRPRKPIIARHATNAGGSMPCLVGEARQRAEHPEQRRRADDDRGTRRSGTGRSLAAAVEALARGHVRGGHPRIGRAPGRRSAAGRATPRGPSRGSGPATVRPIRYAARGRRRRLADGAGRLAPRVARRIPVNGMRIPWKASIETRKPANRSRAQELARAGTIVEPRRVRDVRDGEDESVEGDEERRRQRLWVVPVGERGDPPRRRDEVHRMAASTMSSSNRNWSFWLAQVQRVAEGALLGREHVRREDDAQDQREAAVMLMNR